VESRVLWLNWAAAAIVAAAECLCCVSRENVLRQRVHTGSQVVSMSSASGSDVTPRIASRCRCRQVCGQYSSAAAAAAADDDDDDDAVTLQLVG